ncbi:MAG TPA: hypothetical protein VK489_13220 [Ferruginibacter sp.]|nr:hypothetical protein [Ferruginibacter sp.]
MKKIFFACLLTSALQAAAQPIYKYNVDLTKVTDDQLTVELLSPPVAKSEISFYLPKIVPGTYMNSNYGKYVHNLKAFDISGAALPVSQSGDNSWVIKKANKMHRISYNVEDTWDATIANMVYSMCGTSFEAGKNFVINTPGMFGYFEGMKKMPFEISFTRPPGFYAATGLIPAATNNNTDRFICENADHLYDSPIMYSLPDTTSIKVGNADVLVAVYSPRKMVTSKFIAANLNKLLLGTRDYLGGKLPVDKYAFIFYFNGEQKKQSTTGAWEHSYSSFYSLDERPEKESIDGLVSIASHEFFHIVTPLTISSREVKEFNFNETVLSKHVWLYEGSTEYTAHHVQVWAGLKTPEQFLETLSQKIDHSRSYMNDSLSFTELSKESAGKWAPQYGNVYQKGALISACLDLYLLKLSNAQYGLKDLKHDLSVKYGKDKFFEDEELFGIITEMTFPEIKDFFIAHVEGGQPLPYEKYFAMAGVEYLPSVAEGGKTRKHVLRFIPGPSAAQLKVRNAWLNDHATMVPVANPADVSEIDQVIKALYDVISGPAGPRDWNRFRSLYHPDAYMAAFNAKKELRKFSPAQYVQNNGPFFMQNSFYEKEIGRRVNQFGNVAQVFTAYEFTAGTTPPTVKRGVNSIGLIKENGRWYIMNISWDEESKDQPIPPDYINK